jgi:hypothetical protein
MALSVSFDMDPEIPFSDIERICEGGPATTVAIQADLSLAIITKPDRVMFGILDRDFAAPKNRHGKQNKEDTSRDFSSSHESILTAIRCFP